MMMRNHSVVEMLLYYAYYIMPIISILKSCNIPAGWPKKGLLKEALSEPPQHLFVFT